MAAVLHSFQFSTSTTYCLEFGENYIRFYTNRQQILTASGAIYEIATQYADEHVRELQIEQVGDVIRIVHPSYPPSKLTRAADDDWTFEAIDFNEPPFLDENLTDVTITPDGTAIDAAITLTASDDIFEADHVGSYWRIGHRRSASRIEFDIDSDGNSDTLEVLGVYNVRTYGNWGADLLVQRSRDGGTTWETVAKFHAFVNTNGQGSRSVDSEAEAQENALYRLRVENFDEATEAKAILENFDAIIYGFVEITAVGSGSSASATVRSTLEATTATDIWSEGAWSEVRGYPRSITVHEQRMVYGGTAHQPSTIWGSVIDDFDNFEIGDGDDFAYSFTLAGKRVNAIQWLASQTVLLAGTTGSEWRIVGDDIGGTIRPTQAPDAKQQSFYGSEYMPAVNTGDAILFMERKGRQLRELRFVLEADKWVADDLMLLAEHLTKAGTGRIVQMSWQPDIRVLWCVTEDGRLLGLTYDRRQNVVGWHPHETDGEFRAVACIFGDTDAADEAWFIVERTVSGGSVFYVELMNPDHWTDKEDGFFVDAGLSYDGTPANTFAGLTHLIGETIDVLADGVIYESLTVDSSGEFSLPSGVTASVVHAGLRYESKLSPFRIDADSRIGVHATKTKRVSALSLRLLQSCVPSYARDGTTFQGVEPEGMTTTDPDSPPLLGADEAEDVALDFGTGWDTNPIVEITESRPVPLTVLAMVIDYDVGSGV